MTVKIEQSIIFDLAKYAQMCVEAPTAEEREAIMQTCEQEMIAYLRYIKTNPLDFPEKMQALLTQFKEGITAYQQAR